MTATTGGSRAAPEDGHRALAWPGDPEGVAAADIDFTALAHVLANTCRRGGRMRHFHSLAAHAVIVSEVEGGGLAVGLGRALGGEVPW